MSLNEISNTNLPKSVRLSDNGDIKLLVHGQGVYLFANPSPIAPVTFYIHNNNKTDGIVVNFTTTGITSKRYSTGEYYIDPNNTKGLMNTSGIFYWYSLDSQNTRLIAGFGEARMETKEYEYKLPAESRSFLESLTSISISSNISSLRLLRDPITANVSLFVKDRDTLTMNDVAKNKYVPVANMNSVCQQLYNCVSGPNFVLNTPDFPNFTEAIEYSINTPGLWCYRKLKEKATEFDPNHPDPSETYLRITMGQNNGESPGIPYVMEIWPVGHYSPVHNHSSANAIIRVLSGEIHVDLYPFLGPGAVPFGSQSFKENDVTWITSNLNQVHRLKNLDKNTKACITIQCYMYSKDDVVHYDYFDYLDSKGTIQHYNPDSDKEFMDFKRQMQLEWNSRHIPSRL